MARDPIAVPSRRSARSATRSPAAMSLAGSPMSSGEAASRKSWKVARSPVGGSARNPAPPNTTRPMRSPGRAEASCHARRFAARSRVPPTSATFMERLRSRVTMMSRPVRASGLGWRPICGRASASTAATSASQRSATRAREAGPGRDEVRPRRAGSPKRARAAVRSCRAWRASSQRAGSTRNSANAAGCAKMLTAASAAR